jgi:hypothetical protein
MKKIITRLSLLCVSAILLASCASSTPEAVVESQAQQKQTQEAQRKSRVKALKTSILKIAEAASNTQCDQDDNYPEITKLLSQLTNELVSLTPAQTEAEKLPKVAGGWKQVWANLDSSSPDCISADDIYQVVFAEGYYWNISKNISSTGEAGGFLRGKYEVTDNFLAIEFTDIAVSPTYFSTGTDLVDLATRAEQKEFIALPPNVPVGVKGELYNVYVDDTLRIVTGNDDLDDGQSDGFFVLVPATVLD